MPDETSEIGEISQGRDYFAFLNLISLSIIPGDVLTDNRPDSAKLHVVVERIKSVLENHNMNNVKEIQNLYVCAALSEHMMRAAEDMNPLIRHNGGLDHEEMRVFKVLDEIAKPQLQANANPRAEDPRSKINNIIAARIQRLIGHDKMGVDKKARENALIKFKEMEPEIGKDPMGWIEKKI